MQSNLFKYAALFWSAVSSCRGLSMEPKQSEDLENAKLQAEFLRLAGEQDVEGLNACLSRMSAKSASSARDSDGQTALHLATFSGNLDMVKALLASAKMTEEAVSAQDNEGFTALHYAYENLEMMREFLKSPKMTQNAVSAKRVSPWNIRPTSLAHKRKERDTTVLHLVVFKGKNQNKEQDKKDLEIVKELLASGKVTKETLSAQEWKGRTVFHVVCAHERAEILKLLLASDKLTTQALSAVTNGAMRECTALHYAASKDTVGMRELLQSRMMTDAIVRAQDADGHTALHYAANNGCLENVKELLAKMEKDVVNAKDNAGETALDAAVRSFGEFRTFKMRFKYLEVVTALQVLGSDSVGDFLGASKCLEVIREEVLKMLRSGISIVPLESAKRFCGSQYTFGGKNPNIYQPPNKSDQDKKEGEDPDKNDPRRKQE